MEPELRASQHYLSGMLTDPPALYRVLDIALSPAMVRVRTCRKGHFAGQAAFGRYRSKTEWVCSFKVALVVTQEGVITAFFLATANCDERLTGDALITRDRRDAYLLLRGLRAAVVGRLWGYGRRYSQGQLPLGLAGGRLSLGVGQAPAHRGSHKPDQRPLRPGTASG